MVCVRAVLTFDAKDYYTQELSGTDLAGREERI
jgi:hypothetical protein